MRAEMKKRGARVREIATALGRSEDYLRRVASGARPITVERILKALHHMEIDPGRFFANALGSRVHRDALLEDVERMGEVHPRLERIEQATARLEVAGPPAAAPRPIEAEAMLADVLECTGKEQRRRLRKAAKYRHPAFAAAYLEHLDALRYDDPKEARQNAEVMAVWLIPELPVPRRQCLALQLEAIGVYASSLRQTGKFATAARALRGALAVARAHELKARLADLLQRAAWVLSSHGRFSDAMDLLDEALVICFDLGLQEELARVQVDRGVHRYYLEEFQPAVEALEQALGSLRSDSPRDSRNRLVAYQVLGRCFDRLGDLGRARSAAAQAVAESGKAARVFRASLLWDHGVFALESGLHELAEERLREAFNLFGGVQDSVKPLVALDLTKTLLAQGRTLEAIAIATGMAEYMMAFRGNRLAQATITELMQTAVEGKMSLDAIERAQAKLKSAGGRAARNPAGTPTS